MGESLKGRFFLDPLQASASKTPVSGNRQICLTRVRWGDPFPQAAASEGVRMTSGGRQRLNRRIAPAVVGVETEICPILVMRTKRRDGGGAMRRVRYAVVASLDGYIAGPKGETDWIIRDPTVDFTAIVKIGRAHV